MFSKSKILSIGLLMFSGQECLQFFVLSLALLLWHAFIVHKIFTQTATKLSYLPSLQSQIKPFPLPMNTLELHIFPYLLATK